MKEVHLCEVWKRETNKMYDNQNLFRVWKKFPLAVVHCAVEGTDWLTALFHVCMAAT